MTIHIRSILVPVDFSEHTPRVLEWAAHLAHEHDSRLLLIHAVHMPVEFQQVEEGVYLPPDFWKSVRGSAEAQINGVAEELRRDGLEVETLVCEGYAATVIVDEAALRDVDLIVIGTHGLSGLKHLLMGSIAERVVHKAACPVLTVKTVS